MDVLRLVRIAAYCAILLSPLSQAQEKTDFSSWLNHTIAQHPDVLSQRSLLDSASAQQRAASQPIYNPELELEYERTDINTRVAGISQTLDWGDKQSLSSRIAELQHRAESASYQAKRQVLASELMQALARYQTSTQQLSIAEHRREIMSRFQSIAEQRYKAGDLPQIERDLALLANSEASFQLANQRAVLTEARHKLLSITGSRSESWPDFPRPNDAIEQTRFDYEKYADLLPTMKQSRAEMDVSRLLVQLKQKEQQPDPTIGFRAGKEGKETLTGVTLAIPLYVRNDYQAEVDVANAQHVSKQQQAISLRREILARMQAAASRYEINRKVWQDWEATGQQSLDQQSELLSRLWKSGELSTTDYLVQLKQVLDTQQSASVQQGQFWQAWIEWLSASGEISQWLMN